MAGGWLAESRRLWPASLEVAAAQCRLSGAQPSEPWKAPISVGVGAETIRIEWPVRCKEPP
jgi:hypothetical protein